MSITYSDHLIDTGHYDITPDQERELERDEERIRNAQRYWKTKVTLRVVQYGTSVEGKPIYWIVGKDGPIRRRDRLYWTSKEEAEVALKE